MRDIFQSIDALTQSGWFQSLPKSLPPQKNQVLKSLRVEDETYRQLRRGVLSEKRLLAYEKEIEAWLGSAADRNFSVWGWTFDPEQLSPRERQRPILDSDDTLRDVNPSSYEEAVEWMMEYIVDRGQWMDEHIDSLRQHCHPSYSANQRAR